MRTNNSARFWDVICKKRKEKEEERRSRRKRREEEGYQVFEEDEGRVFLSF